MNSKSLLTLTRAYTALGFISAQVSEHDDRLALIMGALDDYMNLLIEGGVTEPIQETSAELMISINPKAPEKQETSRDQDVMGGG